MAFPLSRLVLSACLLATASAVQAENVKPGPSIEEFPLRLTDAAHPSKDPEEITYRTTALDDHGFNRIVRKVSVPTLTIYRPAHVGHRGASLVVCPGGGYEMLVIDREGRAMGRYFQEQGLTVAVLKYRLPDPASTGDGLPLSQQDALAAIQYVRAHASKWGIDEHRVGILGSSAGGHLAGSTAFFGKAANGSRPDFVALLYPVICMDPPYTHVGSRLHLLGPNPTPERVAEFSLERQARSGLPPFFLAHAKNDKTAPPENSELLANALRRSGVPVDLHLFSTGSHGFGLGNNAETATWKGHFLDWLDALP